MNHEAAELEARAYELESEASQLRAKAIRLRAKEETRQLVAPADEPVSTREAAKASGLSEATLRRLAPDAPVGVLSGGMRRLRWNVPALRAWLAERKTTPAKSGPHEPSSAHTEAVAKSAGLRLVAETGVLK